MKLVYEIEKSDFQKVKDVLFNDDLVGRSSIKFKDGETIGFEDKYYVYISGTEENCEKSEDLMKDLGEKVDKETKEKVLKKIEEEEDQAMQGFGGIFG
ncbi:MAG: hypothetical protein GF368_01115 [Candidatus Aenigmarchaeota archaeon]|nr:hypothetical protein [Candidatus Aenigmarchaeota archaeon]